MFDGEIKITGKHASYVKFLAAKTTQLNKGIPCVGAFKRYIDVYIAGATIGLVKKLKSPIDNSVSETATLFADAVIGEQEKLKILYRIMQLIDDPSLSCDDRLDLAFRYDADDARVKKGVELFNSYARGGIQWLYDEITQNAITSDDYYENISNLVKNFSQDYEEAFPKEED